MILTSSALWLMRDAVDEHFRDIARLRALVVSLRAGDTVGSNFPPAGDAESGQLREALLSLAAEIANRRAAPERRLAAALGAVSEAVVVITAQGQVSLVNGAARALLGSEQVEVGTSVFAALAREPVEEAIGAARSGGIVLAALDTVGGRTLAARVSLLGDGEGVVIAIPGAHGEIEADIAHDLSLHDFPPDAPAPTDATALFDLPAAVVDLETTGLDPKLERIVAIGAVRMHGATVFRAATIDCLVDPGVPIPRVATTIHGIADATVAGMPAFAARFPELTALVGEGVVIGHNVGFDLAMLAAEAARAGLPWQVPVALDTCRIAAALDPHESALDLEDVAARHGINVLGRHTALGDALVTAELWRRLSARLIGRGITTLGEARAFAATAKRVIARQRAAGW
jgi:DNA polymerase-3 subunit epsilon